MATKGAMRLSERRVTSSSADEERGSFQDVLSRSLAPCVLKAETLQRLNDKYRARTFPSKSPIFWQGDRASDIYLLERGRVQLTSCSADGRTFGGRQVRPGEIFGELAPLIGERREHTAWALEQVMVYEIDALSFQAIAGDDPSLALALIHVLARRVMQMHVHDSSKLAPLHRRVARMLMALPTDDVGIVHVTHTELATSLSASREAVTRALSRLRDRGLIATQRRGILLVDACGLQELLVRDEIVL